MHTYQATNPQITLDMRTGVSSSTLVSCGCNVKFCRDSGNRSRYPSESRGWRGGEVCQRSPGELPSRLEVRKLPLFSEGGERPHSPSPNSTTTQLQWAWALSCSHPSHSRDSAKLCLQEARCFLRAEDTDLCEVTGRGPLLHAGLTSSRFFLHGLHCLMLTWFPLLP